MRTIDGFKSWFGNDKWFWLVPTKPNLYVNYLERLYLEEEIGRARSMKEF